MTDTPNMEERSPGVWRLRVFTGRDPVTGQPRQASRTVRTTGRGKREAKRLLDSELAKLREEVDAGQHGATAGTVAHLLNEWTAKGREHKSPTTLYEDERRIAHVLPVLGHIQLRQLTGKHLDDFYRRLRRQGVEPGSVMAYHKMLRAALQEARGWGYVRENVALWVKPPQVKRKRNNGDAMPSTSDVRRLICEAGTYADALVLLAVLGLRDGELCGLRFSDRDGDALTVERSIWQRAGKNGVKLPKSGDDRTVALEDRLTIPVFERRWADHLTAAAMAEVEPNAGGYLFSRDPLGGDYWLPQTVSHRFIRLRDRLEMSCKLHGLRHWCNSTAADNDVSIEVRSEQLGHSLPGSNTNLAHYTHPSFDRQREMVRILAAEIS